MATTTTTGPPATPISLLGLPASWLLQLAMTSALNTSRHTRLALFRTCSFFRDAVAQHRKSDLAFNVPIAEERFQDEVDRLCTLARRSRNTTVLVMGPTDQRHNPAPWTETEPCITHLLVCAMAQLGGEQPLAGIKRIKLADLQVTAPVPAWVRALCPNVECLEAYMCTFAAQPERVSTSLSHTPQAAPATCSCLKSLSWAVGEELRQDDKPLQALVRRQLAALPSLTHLRAYQWDMTLLDLGDGIALSTSLTSLVLTRHGQPTLPQRLRAMFPQLRELVLTYGSVTEDAELDGLLRHLSHIDVRFNSFNLTQSFTHRAWPWSHLKVQDLDVDSFARLPLHGILTLKGVKSVRPSADAQAVARVAEAATRWGGLGVEDVLSVAGRSSAAVLATLRPLLAALPEGQLCHLTLRDLGVRAVTPEFLQQLGAALPSSGIKRLSLGTRIDDTWQPAPDAWGALLPSLPATVERLDLLRVSASEQQLLDLCTAATRRIQVVVSRWDVPDARVAAVRARLAERSGGAGEHLVTLTREE